MAALSSCYSPLFDGLNAEVQVRWLQMVVRNSFYPELPKVQAFLLKHVSRGWSQGRGSRRSTNRKSPPSLQTSRMYTMPLYDDLVVGVMRCFAVEVFTQTQCRLHPNLRRTLQQMLFQSAGVTSANQCEPALDALPPSPSPSPSAAINVSA